MLTKVKKFYQLYLLPMIFGFSFNFFTQPAMAADISRKKVAADGAAQYNQILIVIGRLFGISLGFLLLLAGAFGIMIGLNAGKSLSQADSQGFQRQLGALGRLTIDCAIVTGAVGLLYAILQFNFFPSK